MGEKQVNLEELRLKLEATIKTLSQIVMDLTLIAGNLKLEPSKASVPKPVQHPIDRLEQVRNSFPEDLEEMLTFEESEGFIIVKTRGYLGSESFAHIASVVRELGGEWISAGKSSHFRVPKVK